ncbi:MAG: response regulator receiver protein [Chloroflexi bacterium OLB15]|nr:MAG: response regulator receiver protein [Chloroflexi bacterium OLB15]
MASLPRILTVDPTGTAAQLTRAALNLLERHVIQVDVPGDLEALDELENGRFRIVIAALVLSDTFDGIALAKRIKQIQPEANIVLIGDEDNTEFEPQTREEASFLYMRRPLDGAQFVRVLSAALDGKDIVAAAYSAPPPKERTREEAAVIPPVDVRAAGRIIDTLLNDVGAMAVVLSNRAGEVLLEHGAVGYIDRDDLTNALLPTVGATIGMGRIVGGHSSSLMVYDGANYSVYVISVGLHHFLSLVFNAATGARAMGAVTRYGRRASEDLIALIGASALIAEAPATEGKRKKRTTTTVAAVQLELDVEMPIEPTVVKAEEWGDAPVEPAHAELPLLEPIQDLDITIFQQDLNVLDEGALEDLFDPDKLAEIANETRRERGPLTYDEARELGLIP